MDKFNNIFGFILNITTFIGLLKYLTLYNIFSHAFIKFLIFIYKSFQ